MIVACSCTSLGGDYNLQEHGFTVFHSKHLQPTLCFSNCESLHENCFCCVEASLLWGNMQQSFCCKRRGYQVFGLYTRHSILVARMELIHGQHVLLAQLNGLTKMDEIHINISCLPSSIMISIQPRNVLKNPHLFNKLSKLFRDVKFWSVQTQNSVETLFLSERANTQLFRTSKIFEIDALFMKLEGFLCWSQVLETFHAYLKHTCMHVRYMHACMLLCMHVCFKYAWKVSKTWLQYKNPSNFTNNASISKIFDVLKSLVFALSLRNNVSTLFCVCALQNLTSLKSLLNLLNKCGFFNTGIG